MAAFAYTSARRARRSNPKVHLVYWTCWTFLFMLELLKWSFYFRKTLLWFFVSVLCILLPLCCGYFLSDWPHCKHRRFGLAFMCVLLQSNCGSLHTISFQRRKQKATKGKRISIERGKRMCCIHSKLLLSYIVGFCGSPSPQTPPNWSDRLSCVQLNPSANLIPIHNECIQHFRNTKNFIQKKEVKNRKISKYTK